MQDVTNSTMLRMNLYIHSNAIYDCFLAAAVCTLNVYAYPTFCDV